MLLRLFLLASSFLLAAISAHAQVAAPSVSVKAPAKIETFLVPICLAVAADGTDEYRTTQKAVVAVRDFMQVSAVIFI